MEKKTKIRTGIFGGSFNPIHIGHLALANYLCEFGGLDELWFLVSPHNPLKQQSDLIDDNLRLELVKLATKGYDKFHVSDFEFHLPRPSYSINTLNKLKEAYPEREFVLIIGADNWTSFDKWKDSEKIVQDFSLMIYPRAGYHVDSSSLPENVSLIDSPIIEISSTFIRDSIKDGKDIRYFLHPDVYSRLMKEYKK